MDLFLFPRSIPVMLNRSAQLQTVIIWISDGVTVSCKATGCIYSNFYMLFITFSSWKWCADSWFSGHLIYTNGKKLDDPCLKTSYLPDWAESSCQSLNNSAIKGLFISSFFLNFFFNCLSSVCKWSLCASFWNDYCNLNETGVCFFMGFSYLNSSYLAFSSESCLYSQYLSETVPLV